VNENWNPTKELADRANCIFNEQWRANLRRADRLFAGLLVFQWICGVVAALVISPKAWAGQVSQTHIHVWAAVFLGGAIAAFPILLVLLRPCAVVTRHSVAVAQMLFGGLLIHLGGGRIETHFHVFGSLAFLAFYRDWRVLISASAVVAVDHLLRGFYWPQSVYGVLGGAEWRWAEHAGWVVFEDIFLIASCLQGVREMKEIAQRQVLLEAANQRTEQTVRERTAELLDRNSELLTTTEKLRVSETRTRAILDSAMDCIINMDHEGNVIEFNPAAERTFGYRRDQVLGQPLDELIIPTEFRERHRKGLARYLATGEEPVINQRLEMAALRADGTVFPIELAIIRIPVDGPPIFAGFLRDLTERKEAEQRVIQAREESIKAESANRAKNEFLSRMSHELRTPLNAILGFGQVLEMNPLSDDQRECVNQITRGGKHLLGLINEVLNIARIEAGRMDLSPEPVRVADMLREVLDLVQPLGAAKQIRLRADLANVNGHCVLADNQKLKQVLLNLLSNAVKYNRDQGEVTLSCEQGPPGRLILIVSDTGPGIPSEKLGRLFVPFDRLGAEQTSVEGSGLGLPLSKGLVELMGGTLSVTSAVGQGSRFCVDLAQAQGAPQDVAEAVAKSTKDITSGPAKGWTLLYIEDNLDNVRLVQRILEHRPGNRLLTAMQGSLGLELARRPRPDLILLDVHLPDINGDKLLEQLKATEETSLIPVVVISADATARQIETLREAGAWDYLTKPIDVPQFLEIVDVVLKK
jgi:two-component system, sensor histidine kinase and response regulator